MGVRYPLRGGEHLLRREVAGDVVPSGAPEPVDLLLARIGSTVLTAYRNPGEDWAIDRVHERDDLPEVLQWGRNACSGYATRVTASG